jgi:hypothetical protein
MGRDMVPQPFEFDSIVIIYWTNMAVGTIDEFGAYKDACHLSLAVLCATISRRDSPAHVKHNIGSGVISMRMS